MCDVLLPPGVNPTAVKYIYHINNKPGGKFIFSAVDDLFSVVRKIAETKVIDVHII
jgi:hypothetical protein